MRPHQSDVRAEVGDCFCRYKDCSVCTAEKDAALQLAQSSKKIKVLLVDVDEAISAEPQISAGLFDRFDLTSLPYIIISDKKGVIQRRYVSLME